jgi:hypothetical protein
MKADHILDTRKGFKKGITVIIMLSGYIIIM